MIALLFATNADDAARSAVSATGRAIRELRFVKRRWFLTGSSDASTTSPIDARLLFGRPRLGDDPSAEWVVFVPAGDQPTREIIRAIRSADHKVDVIYGDTKHDIRREDRLPTYQRRPSYSPERLRSHDYIGGFVAARRSLVESAGGLEMLTRTNSHDRNLRLCERARHVERVAEVLNVTPNPSLLPEAHRDAVERHISRLGIDASTELDAETPCVKVRRHLRRRPLVSVVIPTRGSSANLRGVSTPLVVNTVRSMLERSSYRELEFIIVADTPTPSEVRAELKRIGGDRLVIIDYDQAFNFAVKNNIGVAHSSGEYVLLLNDDTEIITPDALETMLALCEDESVGVVGPMLYFEDGSIQSAGHVFTPDPTDMYRLQPSETRGAHNYVRVQREASSVIAACLLTSRKVFDEVGGLSTQFPGNWNDIDFALKVQQAGYKVIFTPYAKFYHFESKTRVALRIEAEVAMLGRRWGDILDNDPYFNPRLQRYINMWRSDIHSERSYAEALGPTAPISSK